MVFVKLVVPFYQLLLSLKVLNPISKVLDFIGALLLLSQCRVHEAALVVVFKCNSRVGPRVEILGCEAVVKRGVGATVLVGSPRNWFDLVASDLWELLYRCLHHCYSLII